MIPEKKEIQAFAKQQGISGDYSDFLKDDKASNHMIPGLVPTYTWMLTCQNVCHTLSVQICEHEQSASNRGAT